MRVISVGISCSNSNGSGNGSYYIKVDNNTPFTGTDYLFANSSPVIIGMANDGSSSFRGKIFDIQIQNTLLSDSEIDTLHTNLRTKYTF
jgi:hypothetical protein